MTSQSPVRRTLLKSSPKHTPSTKPRLALIGLAGLFLSGCTMSETIQESLNDGSVKIHNLDGRLTIQKIEVDGAYYIVAVGFDGTAICPAVNQTPPKHNVKQ